MGPDSDLLFQDDIDNFECTCLPDGDTPDKIEQYVGTVPNSACLAQFKDCRLKNPGSKNCPVCGTLQPSDVAAVVPSSTAASSSASSTSSPSVTAASTTPSASSTGAAVRMGAEVGGVAVGLAAALGMLL